MRRFLKTIFVISLVLMTNLAVMAAGPFDGYVNKGKVSRKFFSAGMLRSIGSVDIADGYFTFNASNLKLVDVIECSDEKQTSVILKEMRQMAKSQNLEELWMNSNAELGNESILYGKYDKKNDCYTILMLVEVVMGWKLKCVFVEGEVNPVASGGVVYIR